MDIETVIAGLGDLVKTVDLQGAQLTEAVNTISIDTRTLKPGDCFLAYSGERFDGHTFLAAAKQAGAVLAIGAAARQGLLAESGLPYVVVEDSAAALLQLGAVQRARLAIPMIAVTGSCGKTTTCALIAAILAERGPTLASRKSFNNHVGVPLTLLAGRPEHQHAVVELGTNHPGEIACLVATVRPTVAMITNAAACHLEGLGDVAGVAREKGAIYGGLQPGGCALINADDAYAEYWQGCVPKGCQIMQFSVAPAGVGFTKEARVADMQSGSRDSAAHVRAYVLAADTETGAPAAGSRVHFLTPQGEIVARLPLLGRHNVANAAAAVAATLQIGCTAAEIVAGLASVQPAPGRLVAATGPHGVQILDDTYNANPHSTAAGLQVLSEQPGKRIFVLGDMAELGCSAEAQHEEIGALAYALGVDELLTCGQLSAAATRGFRAAALAAGAHTVRATHFAGQPELLAALRAKFAADTAILIKGSRAAGMERIVVEILGSTQ